MKKDFIQKNLDKMEDQTYPILFVPFNSKGVPIIWIKLRKLTQIQTEACGDFSLIETVEDKIRTQNIKNIRDLLPYAKVINNIVKAALVMPTYQQIFDLIGADPSVPEKLIILAGLEKKLEHCPKNDPTRKMLTEEINALRVRCEFLLPEDFTSWITCYTLGINDTDIKQVSREMLLESAILAKRGNKSPSDYSSGNFTPFMKKDFDRRAWMIYDEETEEAKGKRR